MKTIKDDVIEVNTKLKTLLAQQIHNCDVSDPTEVDKACKAFVILSIKLNFETTERYLSSIEYMGQINLAAKAILVDYYNDTEIRISSPLKAATVLIDEFAENKSFGGEEQYTQTIFRNTGEMLRVLAHTFITQYAYHKTKSMGAVLFLLNKFKPLEG